MKNGTASASHSILKHLRSLANVKNVAGMARFGINSENTLGISIPVLRSIARAHKKDHQLALDLWESGVHEARILAAFVDDPMQVSEKQLEVWTSQFDSWDVCDQCCSTLYVFTPFAGEKCKQWSDRKETFVKRAAFSLMASLAVKDKTADDKSFLAFLPIIKKAAVDERNFVKKAVNWALRQIGKRNEFLRLNAVKMAQEIRTLDSKAARWIAADALRELESEFVKQKVARSVAGNHRPKTSVSG